jgi:cysteinyl-tRNA synthetase
VMVENSLTALRQAAAVSAPAAGTPGASATLVEGLQQQLTQVRRDFYEAMDDDFNTAAALAPLYGLGRELNRLRDAGLPPDPSGSLAAILDDIAQTFGHLLAVLGLQLPAAAAELVRGTSASGPSDAEIEALVAQRAELRRQRRWADADAVRAELAKRGVTIEDRAGGTSWRREPR